MELNGTTDEHLITCSRICAVGKTSVRRNELKCNGNERKTSLAVRCRKWVIVVREARMYVKNLLNASGFTEVAFLFF